MDPGQLIEALTNFASPTVLLWLFLGGALGAILGILPGLGSTVGLALMLPVAVVLDPLAGLAFLLAIAAVGSLTSDYTSILFGIPGDGTSAALIMDGYPMAKAGEAGRALGASVTASTIGAVVGSIALAVSIPVLRPVVLALGTPEIFMLTVVGASLVGALGGKSLTRGLLIAFVGFAMATVGMDTKTGVPRYMMGQIAFFEGLPLIPITVGLFAVPELINLALTRTGVGDLIHRSNWAGVRRGIGETMRHWLLAVRCSLIAVLVAIVPGVGGGVSQWTAYAHGMQSSKEPERFGKGAIDGIIAPGAANNAKDGGQMIPLVGFGIPGGSTSAVLLGGLIILGFTPGPEMVGERADISIFMVLALSISTILFAFVSLPLLGPLARVANLKPGLAIPVIAALLYVSVFADRSLIIDAIVALLVGLFGWVMMVFGWPRPALLLGFVLGARSESSLWISTSLMGLEWLRRPGVIAMALVAFLVGYTAIRRKRKGESQLEEPEADPDTEYFTRTSEVGFTLLVMGVGAAMLWFGREWSWEAGLFPRFVAVMLLILGAASVVALVRQLRGMRCKGRRLRAGLPAWSDTSRAVIVIGWLIGMMVMIPILGFNIAVPLFVFGYILWERTAPWWGAAVLSLSLFAVLYVGFEVLLSVRLPDGLLM